MASPKRPAPPPDPDPYVTEERLCIIEFEGKVDRSRAVELHRKELERQAKRWTPVEMFT